MIDIPKEIEELFLADGINKNIRISFPNGEYRDLVNDDIEYESVKYTESTSSSGSIKLGIAEASMIEFKAYDIPNIRNYYINAEIEIDISSLPQNLIQQYGTVKDDVPFPFYAVPYGQFIVSEFKQKAESKMASITAYDAIASNVLKRDVGPEIYSIAMGEFSNLSKYMYYLFPDSQYNVVEMSEWKTDQTITRGSVTPSGGVSRMISSLPVVRSYPTMTWATYYTEVVVYYERVSVDMGITDAEHMYIIGDNSIVIANDVDMKLLDTDISNAKSSYFEVLKSEVMTQIVTSDWETILRSEYDQSNPFRKPTLIDFSNPAIGDYSWLPNGNSNFYRVIGWDLLTYSYYRRLSSDPSPTYSSLIGIGSPIVSRRFDTYIHVNDVKYKQLYSPQHFVIPDFDIELDREQFEPDELIPYSDLVSALAEMRGMFCKINRITHEVDMYQLSAGATIYPREDLFPNEDLYPTDSTMHTYYRDFFSECDYEDYLTRPIGRVFIQKDDYIYSAELPDYDYTRYSELDLSNNFFLERSIDNPESYMTMLNNVLGIVAGIYFRPFNGKFKGLPFIEAGDCIRVETINGFFDTFVMRRTLSGIQFLDDNIEAQGEA